MASAPRPHLLRALISMCVFMVVLIMVLDTRSHVASPPHEIKEEDLLLDKLAIVFPVTKNTDMRFFRNTWMRKYLYPVCDWHAPNCRIVCNRDSTYRTLDKKTVCFSRALKEVNDKEFFIKLDDDTFVDKDYVVELLRKYSEHKSPLYISEHSRFVDYRNRNTLNNVLYGNGKFYMFNKRLVQCLNTEIEYEGWRNEDAVFGGMVRAGCGESSVDYVQEDNTWIWHKVYESKNKHINLAYIEGSDNNTTAV